MSSTPGCHSLIIGGTKGIGRALVERLSREGDEISIVGRTAPSPDRAVPGAHFISADLRKIDSALSKITAALDQRGKLSRLVFLQRFRGTGDSWIGEIETSLTATQKIIEALAEHFDGDGSAGAAIVIVSSNANRFVARNQSVGYHVAKAGLLQMARYYAAVLGPRGIRVNVVSPCTILKAESKDFYLNNAPVLDLYRRITPLGRMGTAEEVAEVIAFLSGPGSSFVTGQEIVVDGGLSLLLHDAQARELMDASGERNRR